MGASEGLVDQIGVEPKTKKYFSAFSATSVVINLCCLLR
jgi:hypothetical protein